MKKIYTLLCCACFTLTYAQDLELNLFASGFDRPVNIKHAGDDRLYVAEQDGIIKILNANSSVEATPFLDIETQVESGGNEEGLLGLAFHPDYVTNGYFFVNYTRDVVGMFDNETVISRFTRSSTNPLQADPSSELVILSFTQPYSNHNGGELQFGPDGYLYISTGDGGSGGDPDNNSQNRGNLLGNLLRIDVNNSTVSNPYDIPADNPFVGNTSALDEIWAYGLRNPWKFSFDSVTGDVWIADVGQNAREEINMASSTSGGLNYGWRCYEGNSPYSTFASECNGLTLTFPVSEYTHSGGRCSITGGYVYRGSTYPNLVGKYFFADICTQEVGFLEFTGGNWNSTFESFSGGFVAFGEDINGELYVSTLGGNIFRLTDALLSIEDDTLNTINIYPNPAKEVLHIDRSNNVSLSLVEITIYDIQGKNVKSILSAENSIENIKVSDLKRGFYILKIKSENGEQITEKFVVN